MQVFLNHVHPFGIPGLIVQLLAEHTKDSLPTGMVWMVFTDSICSAERISVLSQQSGGVKTGHVKAGGYPEAQGIRKEERRSERDAWLT